MILASLFKKNCDSNTWIAGNGRGNFQQHRLKWMKGGKNEICNQSGTVNKDWTFVTQVQVPHATIIFLSLIHLLKLLSCKETFYISIYCLEFPEENGAAHIITTNTRKTTAAIVNYHAVDLKSCGAPSIPCHWARELEWSFRSSEETQTSFSCAKIKETD